MSLLRWDPFGEMYRMLGQMNPSSRMGRPPAEGGGSSDWLPSTDISESEKEYTIRAALPAVKKEDLHVTLDNGLLTIKGERRQQQQDKTEKFHRVESFYGSFERSFALPENVNEEAISSESRDGVLTIHIPKAQKQQAKPKEVSVQ
jgi:HSP20 family protein